MLSDRLDKASEVNEDLVADVNSRDETIVVLKEAHYKKGITFRKIRNNPWCSYLMVMPYENLESF